MPRGVVVSHGMWLCRRPAGRRPGGRGPSAAPGPRACAGLVHHCHAHALQRRPGHLGQPRAQRRAVVVAPAGEQPRDRASSASSAATSTQSPASTTTVGGLDLAPDRRRQSLARLGRWVSAAAARRTRASLPTAPVAYSSASTSASGRRSRRRRSAPRAGRSRRSAPPGPATHVLPSGTCRPTASSAIDWAQPLQAPSSGGSSAPRSSSRCTVVAQASSGGGRSRLRVASTYCHGRRVLAVLASSAARRHRCSSRAPSSERSQAAQVLPTSSPVRGHVFGHQHHAGIFGSRGPS
jgi:hypothetical protein